MADMIVVNPKTNAIFAIFDPITLDKAISVDPSKAALKLTINSGAEVANDTTVIPIINLDKLNLNDKPTDAFTKKSPPNTNKAKPINMYTTLIIFFFF